MYHYMRTVEKSYKFQPYELYSSSVDVTGYNTKNRKVVRYPNLQYTIGLVSYGVDLTVLKPPEDLEGIMLDVFADGQFDSDEQIDDVPQKM
ncbi:hypothetical protein FQA39_LY00765 [Lamprigera yunnana]|nr:hypothetical protein FQA39_LY00765 [Lamprigera yunnana]